MDSASSGSYSPLRRKWKRPLLNKVCSACSNIRLSEIAVGPFPTDDPYDEILDPAELKKLGYNHIENAQDLVEQYRACDLCSMIAHQAMEIESIAALAGGQSELPKDVLQNLPIKFGPPDVYKRPQSGGLNMQHMRVAIPTVSNNSYYQGMSPYMECKEYDLRLNLIAEPDSEAASAGDITGQPNLYTSDSSEAFELIRHRLSTCAEQHSGICVVTMSGRKIENPSVLLPKRLSLLGPENKRPIRTTKATLEQHLVQISWGSIPKTFQDAILVTHAMGLEYIWIDNLCIVQDDEDDWLTEAPRMRSVYQNTHLTIAAAAAENSEEGLFFDRSKLPNPWAVTVPYLDKRGKVCGSMSVRPIPGEIGKSDLDDPDSSPLCGRSWVLQEELLSRRVVYFQKRNIFWKYKTLQISETNEPSIYNLLISSDARDWATTVENYTQRGLTFPKDKLIALAGLVEELQLCHPNNHYLSGIWLKDVHHQLLWHRQTAGLVPNPHIKVPSWSWASLDGPVWFLENQYLNDRNIKADIQLQSQHELHIRGSLLSFVYAPRPSDGSSRHETAEGLMQAASSNEIAINGAIYPCLGIGSENALPSRVSEEIQRTLDRILFLADMFPKDQYLIIDTSQGPRGLCALDQSGGDVFKTGSVLYCAPIIKGCRVEHHLDDNIYCYSLVLERLSLNVNERGMHTYIRKGVAVLHAHEGWTGSLSECVEYLLV